MTTRRIDPGDPMFKPLTMTQVMQITQRSQRTIERWVKDKRLTRYEEHHRRKIVFLFDESEVVDVETERAAADRENRDRIRRRRGRPGPRKPRPDAQLDLDSSDVVLSERRSPPENGS